VTRGYWIENHSAEYRNVLGVDFWKFAGDACGEMREELMADIID